MSKIDQPHLTLTLTNVSYDELYSHVITGFIGGVSVRPEKYI
jgi:hypothetical protein